jgi:hypothetical protein
MENSKINKENKMKTATKTAKTVEHTKTDIETNAIYLITDDPNTPPDVKKFLLNYLFEKNGISVEFSEVETQQDEKIERDDEIRLTPERACELSEWIITQTTGIYSADALDDRQKQAFLILLSAIVYEEEMTKRENILFDVTKRVFGYSFASDNGASLFIKNGFERWRSGKWNVQAEECE